MSTPKEIKTTQKCPICGLPTHEKYTPFCSKRCADIDLGRWLKGFYAVPSVENTLDEKETLEEE